jgi:hypothetical protein
VRLLGWTAQSANLRARRAFGAVAQLGEHLVCNQGVAGSIPVRSTCLDSLSAVPLRGFFRSRKQDAILA